MYISAINTAPEFENKSNQAQDSEIPEMIQHRGGGSPCVNLWIKRISYICGITAILLLILITIIVLFIETQNSMASFKDVEKLQLELLDLKGKMGKNLHF